MAKKDKTQLAIERKAEIVAKYGGKHLAFRLGISHPAISKWKKIPPFRAFQISKFGDYSMEYIRPDVEFHPPH